MKHSVPLNHNLIEIINCLPEKQFKNFCVTFFESLGLTNIESVPVAESGYVAGKGTIELGSLMSYHFAFFGKQHTGVVPEKVIQELRDVMENRTNKGIILTTGSFSRRAKRQAKIKGKVPIDLFDGNDLIHRLKNLQLKISIETGKVFKDK
jgi:restriction system protein